MKVIKSKSKSLKRSNIPVDPYLIYLSWQQGTRGIRTIVKHAKDNTDPPADIKRNMKSNWNSNYFEGQADNPGDFLRAWKRQYDKKESYVRRNFESVIAQDISESTLLSDILNIISEVQDNELAKNKIQQKNS